jgi:hypothetical protein
MGLVTDKPGWRSIHVTATDAVRRMGDTPLGRLARVHAVLVAGDALVAIALAGSLFFSIDPGAARWRVAFYLLFTMAPFALVAPLVGPAIDRAKGGRKNMVILSGGLRALVAFMMVGDLDSLLLFPEAFAMLVLGKGYHVAKSAIVPTTVETDEELVEANSKLAVISALAGFAAALPGLLLAWLGGPEWVLGLAMIVFGVATALALRLPAVAVADESPDELERTELRSAGVLLAATGMGTLRWVVGFVAFLLAFDLRGGSRNPSPAESLGSAMKDLVDPGAASLSDGRPTWWFGVVLAASAVGGLFGSWLAPRLRTLMREESMLDATLAVTAIAALVAVFLGFGPLFSATVVALAVGTCAAAGKQGFDAIVQRDAPDANRGRSFARFETRFQVVWVFGAFIPVLIHIPARLGYFVVAVVAAAAAAWYGIGRRAAGDEGGSPAGSTGNGTGGPEPQKPREPLPPPPELRREPPDPKPSAGRTSPVIRPIEEPEQPPA